VTGPRFHTFGAKVLIVLVGVVALAQLATYLVVSRANRANARELIAQDLVTAAAVFQRVITDRNDILATGATSAAGDYAFKPLFANVAADDATLVSALASIRLRIGADVATFLAIDGATVASTIPVSSGQPTLKRFVTLADADPSPNPRATGYGYIGHELFSFVTVPTRAPDIVGWLVVGFRIDNALARRLKELTSVEVSFADQDAAILATTLSPAVVSALSDAMPMLRTHREMLTLRLAGESSLIATRQLDAGDAQIATLALQYSLTEKLRPALATERLLLYVASGSLALAALISLVFARRLSGPVEALAAHTRVIASGNYSQRIELHRSDELGRLAESFNAMSAGLAERDRVRDLLDKNVSPEVAAQLLRDGSALGGQVREVTIIFVDLRGFTALSEKLPPPELLSLLNRYLDRMSREIERHGGVIDKFIGDAIMALFGAPLAQPDSAGRALAAALAMEGALMELNHELVREGRPALAFGIGVNTAPVVAGNIGSQRRLNYSVIGDGVNIAARLQSLTRVPEYRTNILVSASTLAAARAAQSSDHSLGKALPPARSIGEVSIKGRSEPVAIYALGDTG
jgi:adenylate cyclase